MNLFYKLDENKEINPCTLMEWHDFFTTHRFIDHFEVDGYEINMVFLGTVPRFFEIHVFKDGNPIETFATYESYITYAELLDGKERLIQYIKNKTKEDIV